MVKQVNGEQPKKNGCLSGCLVIVGFLAMFGIVGSFIGSGITHRNDSSVPVAENTPPLENNDESEASQGETEHEYIHFEVELNDGYYTAGIDFPAGKYDIDVISGNGNVISSNIFDGGINAMMGVSEEYEIYQKSYQNISLPEGEYLHVQGGLCIKISSDKANSKPLAERKQEITETITLSNGYFTAGEDFPSGIYNISVIEGNGNIVATVAEEDPDLIVNAMMGIRSDEEPYSEFYTSSYQNVPFDNGVYLKVDGLTVELTPST